MHVSKRWKMCDWSSHYLCINCFTVYLSDYFRAARKWLHCSFSLCPFPNHSHLWDLSTLPHSSAGIATKVIFLNHKFFLNLSKYERVLMIMKALRNLGVFFFFQNKKKLFLQNKFFGMYIGDQIWGWKQLTVINFINVIWDINGIHTSNHWLLTAQFLEK